MGPLGVIAVGFADGTIRLTSATHGREGREEGFGTGDDTDDTGDCERRRRRNEISVID